MVLFLVALVLIFVADVVLGAVLKRVLRHAA
jgi:hypothetical protein